MSRSVFFNRFKRLVGETPAVYLTNWRIRKAKEMLAINKDNISEIGLKVGYQSEAAFNRIFKAKVGSTPAAFRRELV
jgi:AraC-like DNA-binding protein